MKVQLSGGQGFVKLRYKVVEPPDWMTDDAKEDIIKTVGEVLQVSRDKELEKELKHFYQRIKEKKTSQSWKRQTHLTITLPSGEQLSSVASLDSRDAFDRKKGRELAFAKILAADNEQAMNRAMEKYSAGTEKNLGGTETTEGLRAASQKYYKLSRADRRILSRIICPEYCRNTPERRTMREKMLLTRLKQKYEGTASNIKSLKVDKKEEGISNVKSLKVDEKEEVKT